MDTDFSYCYGEGCALADKCQRADNRAKEYEGQLWWIEVKYDSHTDSCPNFLRQFNM